MSNQLFNFVLDTFAKSRAEGHSQDEVWHLHAVRGQLLSGSQFLVGAQPMLLPDGPQRGRVDPT